ncbi:MAG: metalloregulator ArsR/SmtB family transcription factor [Eubacteriales bacterium]|nr:metalloregulator ArsR/SmtB family transcription factor [Eubacteriales bacterium]
MKRIAEKIEVCSEHHVHSNITVPPIPDQSILYQVADLFKVFGDPTRIRILYTLSGGELCVCDIAAVLGMTQSAISHQLRILKEKHLVKFRREGKTIFYSLADSHVETILKQGLNHVME